jgi:hypothetical protein
MTEVNVRVVAEHWRKVRNEYATSDEDLRRSLNREAQSSYPARTKCISVSSPLFWY